MVPSSSQKIILECFPHQFNDKGFVTEIPHFIQVFYLQMDDAPIWGWVMLMIRPFAICLRKTIQNVGACRGLVLLVSVRYKKRKGSVCRNGYAELSAASLHVKKQLVIFGLRNFTDFCI